MFSEAKVTEIYCMADDFCKEFALQQEKYMVKESNHNHRNKPNRMNDAEIMVILILFHSGGFRCFKHYYNEYVCKHLTHLFPRLVSYNRFVELEKDILLPLTIFIKQVLLGTCTGISFVDSTPLRVCRNQRILVHDITGFRGICCCKRAHLCRLRRPYGMGEKNARKHEPGRFLLI